MADKSIVSPAMLRKLLRYEPDTGKLYWRERSKSMFSDSGNGAGCNCRRWNTKHSGKEAFTAFSTGYRCGRIFNKGYQAHRVAWAIIHGELPTEIDHINHNRSDNRLKNLRVVSRQENKRNARMYKNNKSGVCGVGWHNAAGKWRAHIKVGGKHTHLGLFANIAEAIAARKAANIAFGYHPNHGKSK